MKIYKTQNTERVAGENISNSLEKYKKKNVLLMISGGSALGVLEHINTDLLGQHVTLSVVDERFSMDPEINNFCQLEKTKFFDVCIEKGCAIIGTKIYKTETLPKAVMEFETQIRRWKKEFPKGVVVALLGIGEDGHTAGVMPFPESKRLFEDLFLDEEWVVSFDATGKSEYALRFTVTLSFLRDCVDQAVVFVKGQNKKLALDMLADTSLPIQQVPAKILCQMKDVTLCTDIKMDDSKLC